MNTKETIASNYKSVLILDYDGTLAPFVVDRNKAYPYPGIIERLVKIYKSGSTRLIIMSGRTIDDLKPLLNLDFPVEIWGCHGVEREQIDGTTVREKIPKETMKALKEAADICHQYLPPNFYEIKPTSIAVHKRGGDHENIHRKIEPLFHKLAEKNQLEVHYFDEGVELRPNFINKGTAVSRILDEEAGKQIAYLGDDFTDEDAFDALGSQALKVLVRAEPRETKADIRISPPQELLNFLDKWIENGYYK